MTEQSFIGRLADDVMLVLTEVEQQTQDFAAQTGIKCRPGCGQCCLKPGVDVRPLEFLPLARMLIETGRADAAFDAAKINLDGPCVFYEGQAGDTTLGRCGVYEHRPSLCRLFGFAAVSGKHGAPELAACHWHKKLQPEVVEKAHEDIRAGRQIVPKFSEFSMKLSMLAPGTGLEHVMPINRALVLALEKIALGDGR